MSQKHFILVFCLLFAAAALFLFWQNSRELDPSKDKNFWTLSFTYPDRTETLDFTIENWSESTNFDYTITEGKQVIVKDSVKVERGRKVTLKPLHTAREGVPTVISVTDGKEKKEIYRK